MKLKNSRLYQYALSDANIFSAIYSMESYIYEKGLLSSDDIELYYKLTDKFNFTYLSEVIHICKKRLDKVLNDDNELFNTQVYFQIKKKTPGTDEITYRPIHSASLIDQICMVSLLNVIMYEIKFDSNNVKESEKKETTEKCFTNKIQLSGLAKLLPSNFHGNIPSTQPEKLFVDWKPKYKEYSDAVINKYYEYSKSNKYSHEVCLDIEDFFPSINPKHIFDFIINKLSTEFNRDNDLNCLQTIVSKLLYFELSNIDSEWSNAYYREHPIIIDDKYYCKGIAQGLPQSYFFGNICMIKIAQCIEKFYPGDAYYYVDDSVIYTSNGSDKIEKINEAIKEVKWAAGKMNEPYINKRLLQKQTECNYSIKIHPNGEKSTITPISEAYNGLTSLKTLAGLTSNINNAIYLSVDEIEDTSTEKKIEAIVSAIDQAKKEIKKEDNQDKSSLYRLKLLNRYRKFFIFRLKIIQNRNFDNVNILDEFLQKYGISQDTQFFNLDNFFEKYEEDIFQGEVRLLFSLFNAESVESKKLRTALNDFDYLLAKRGKKNNISSILYLSKDVDGAIILANHKSQKYKSLQKWCDCQFKLPYKSTPKKQQDHLEKAIMDIQKSTIFKGAEYAMTVFDVSNEYKRCLINTVISRIVNIPLSDDLIFYKQDNRSVKYYEFRLLAFARNRFFKFDRFMSLALDVLQDADDSDVVDYKIMDALHIFIAKVNDPEKVDSLILVHRLVNGLWKNGSKFLHFYTLHNEEHSVELIKNVVRLVNTIDYFSLKKLDFYILFLACYLHDISMVIHPNIETFCEENNDTNKIYSNFIEALCDSRKPVINKTKPEIKQFILEYFKTTFEYFENSVRSAHAQQSAKFIIDRCETPYLKFIDKAILQTVAHVSEAHGYDCEEVYGRKSFAKTEIYSLKYMMILIRMADLLDLSKDRVSYYIMKENITHMSKVSQFHWISHYITDNCTIEASFKPIYNDEKSKIRPLDSGSIIEQLSFDIYLNTRQITKVEPSNKTRYCSKIGCEHFSSEGKLVININEPNATTTQECKNKDCTFICNWITMKHEYLFSELHALLKYLNTVNNGLFRTAIEVNVHYENKRDLDPEFNDIVMNYISPMRS